MKISTAIKILEGLKKEHGDLTIAVLDPRLRRGAEFRNTAAMITVSRSDDGAAKGIIFLDSQSRDELHGYGDDDKLDDHD